MVQRASKPAALVARGFTLIELLVVIAIIAVLVGLTVVIASHIGGAGKQKQTEQTLRTLDSMLQAYITSKGAPPPPYVLDPRPQTATTKVVIPIVDGRNFSAPLPTAPDDPYPAYMNTVGLFLLQCKEVPEADVMLKGIDAKLIHEYDPDVTDPAGSPNFTQQPSLLTAFDGWGRPIRYVHPSFKGVITDSGNHETPMATSQVLGPPPPGKSYGITSIRRYSNPYVPLPPPAGSTDPRPMDADGGIPVGSTPYFYSIGADADPGRKADQKADDNVYTTRPKFPK